MSPQIDVLTWNLLAAQNKLIYLQHQMHQTLHHMELQRQRIQNRAASMTRTPSPTRNMETQQDNRTNPVCPTGANWNGWPTANR